MSEPVDRAAVDDPARKVMEDWRRGLADDRRGRAELRRTQGVDDAFDCDAYHRLRIALNRAGVWNWAGGREATVAAVAITLAEIDKDTGDAEDGTIPKLGAALAKITSARFRLLVNTGDVDLFLRLLRGTMPMIDRAAPVWNTAEIVRRWHHPEARLYARRELLISYNDKIAE